mgnify:FL=1
MEANENTFIVTDSETNKAIQEGIEKNRKGNFVVKTNAKKVKVTLKNHKFRFGCNLFMLDEFPDDPNKNVIYRQKFKEVFNLATLPFYWDATEPEEGKTRYEIGSPALYRRPPVDLCIKYCEENNIEPREHALCYDNFFPDWLVDKTVPEIKQYIVKRMQQISRRYADKIPTIEVTNEMFWDKGKTPIYADPDFMVFCYEQAAKYFPKNELCINEWSGDIWNKNPLPWNNYYLIIENLLLKGARVDAIGMQYHMFYNKDDYFKSTRRVYNLRHLIQVMDNFARLKKPFQITEITIPAFTEESADEQAQADIIEQLYSTWFSYPNVEQIIYWNLVDGYAAFTEPGNMTAGENVYRGGLLRFDLSEKPAFQRIKHLVKDVWTTNEQLETKGGAASFRGFYGEYEVEADGKKCIVNFDKDGKEICL